MSTDGLTERRTYGGTEESITIISFDYDGKQLHSFKNSWEKVLYSFYGGSLTIFGPSLLEVFIYMNKSSSIKLN